MKITERRLRMIIRNVIAESARFGRSMPTEMDDLLSELGLDLHDSAVDDYNFDEASRIENSVIIPALQERGFSVQAYPETDLEHQDIGNAISDLKRSPAEYNDFIMDLKSRLSM